MPGDAYFVDVLGLNLRSEPVVSTATRIAVLPQGHRVEKLEEATDSAWWRVVTEVGGSAVEGFVAQRFLATALPAPAAQPAPAAATTGPFPAVHLEAGRADIHRRRDGGRAYPLGELDRPPRADGTIATLTTIADWLAVDDPAHLRYQRKGSTTFCNIYAYDYCELAGAYLPRVWWTGTALASLAAGEDVVPRYGTTVRELGANGLLDWLVDHGPSHGWQRVFELAELQAAANAGEVCIICGQRAELQRSGHIVAVVPETETQHALGMPVSTPLQSEAGWNNYRYSTRRWWVDPKFGHFGFWRCSAV